MLSTGAKSDGYTVTMDDDDAEVDDLILKEMMLTNNDFGNVVYVDKKQTYDLIWTMVFGQYLIEYSFDMVQSLYG